MATARLVRPHGTGSVYYQASKARWVGTYDAGWTAAGKRDRRTVRAATERECHRKLDALIRALKSGEEQSVGGRARTSLKVWLDTWLPLRAREVRPTTYQADESLVRRWIIPTIGKRHMADISPGDVRRVTDAILDHGLVSSTARRAQMILMKALKDAIREGYPVPQRTLLTIAPGANAHDRSDIPLPDALALLRAAGTIPDGSRWVMALLEGLRQAERLGLTWPMVDLDAGLAEVSWQLKPLPYRVKRDRSSGFRVPDGFEARQLDGALHLVRPKTEAGRRIIPLVPLAVTALRAWRDIAPASPHGLVWPRPDGRPALAKDDDAAWYALQDDAQVASVDTAGDGRVEGRRYTVHEARHTTATLLLAADVDVKVIGTILGQASILATRGYQHVDLTMARAAMAALARQIEA